MTTTTTTSKRPKVYVVNKGTHDYSKALTYGDLVYLTEGYYNLLSIGKIYRTVLPTLNHSSPEDLILLCGPTIMNSLVCSIMATKHGHLNLLLFVSSKDGEANYRKRTILLNPEVPPCK